MEKMKYLITKNAYGDLVGFLPFNDGDDLPAPREYFTDFVADVIPSVTLNADAAEVQSLYEICFGEGDTLFVTAFDYSDALVTAMLHRGVTHPPLFVRQFCIYDALEEGSSTPTTRTFEHSGQSLTTLLAHLNWRNRDFVALAIPYADGIEEGKLIEYERSHIKCTLHAARKTALDLTADEIRESCKYIWYNYMLIETTDASISVQRLMDRHEKESDPTLALIWTYVFEQWAHYDCHMPYTLYRLIVDGVLDGYLGGFLAEREILE